jgi:uncharacterized membrane protein YfcA
LKKNKFKKAMVGIVTGFTNGLFGSGGGTIVVPAIEKFLKVETHKAHASAIAIILPLSILSTFIYGRDVSIDWKMIIYVSIGGVIGGYVGAKFLSKISTKWLHRIFGIFMIIAAVRMII